MKINYPLFTIIILLIVFSCSSDSEEPTPKPDTVAPTVNFGITGFSNPGSEPIVASNQIEININAQDAGGIAKVEAFIDDQKVGEDVTAPYQITIDISGYTSKMAQTAKFKDYTLKIVVTDTSGNTSFKEQVINIDNELPVISEVSLEAETVINGDTNTVTFNISDNEGLGGVKTYLNNNLLTEITGANYEINIDTQQLEDGENTLKIEAIDLAENTAIFEVLFIVDNTGPEIVLESLTEGQVIYDPTNINPVATDQYTDVHSIQIAVNETSLASFENVNEGNFELDPEEFEVGENIITISSADVFGNISTVQVSVMVHRKLITINIPENRLNQALIVPMVFLSKMDGSLVTYQEISTDDRQITLSVAEEFELTTEFMLSFYLQDNGGAVGISTHQNLTRQNPEIITLAPPKRKGSGYSAEVPTVNFLSSDLIIGSSGDDSDSHLWLSADSQYSTFLNKTDGVFNITTSELENNANPFDSFYIYDAILGYKYMFLDNPLADDFVLDKTDFSTENIESRNYVVQSGLPQQNTSSSLQIFGALTEDDKNSNKFHRIYHLGSNTALGSPIPYDLNTSFSYYKHSLLYGNYFTERNTLPLETYNIPEVTLSYTNSNNTISLNVQGEDHIVGRIQCTDLDNPIYDWTITFDSQSTIDVIIPDLPNVISHQIGQIHQNQNIKIESVELLSYQSIIDYSDYLQRIVKNQSNVLEVNDWYQLIYASRTGNFNRPIKEFIFQ